MPLLDWAEKKIDRSIISIGESCKTWFQEVWRLIARVLVFWLSILLGFLHKPSFEKWVAEQRGRIHPRRTTAESTHSTGHKQEPLESPRQGTPLGSQDHSSHLSLALGTSNRSEPIAVQRSGSRDFKKRKTPRSGRTGFADLLTSSDDRIRREHAHVAHSFSPSTLISSSAPSQPVGHHFPASFSDELASDDSVAHSYDDSQLLLDGDVEDYSTHEDIDYEQKSTISDDYDEFYGHTKSKILTRRKSPRPGSHHRRQASAGSHHHVFSIEGFDSATSPLLASPRDHTSSGPELGHPQPHHLPGLQQVHAHHVTTWTFSTPRDAISESPVNEANASDIFSKALSLGLPAPSDTPSRTPTPSQDPQDSHLIAASVPIVLEPPLAAETKKARPTHKRARSMSPSANSRYSVSAPGSSNAFLGGTGRRGSSKLRKEYPDAPKQRYEEIDIHKDRIFTSDKLNTGALEDLRMYALLQIDNVTDLFRRAFKSIFSFVRNFSLRKILIGTVDNILTLILSPNLLMSTLLHWTWNLTFGLLILIFYLPSRLISGMMKSTSFDKRSTEAIVNSQGYPYESYEVETDDGYILKLERLPRRKSNRVIYFQHGVVDNSFAWFGHVEGEAASAVAFRAYDEGHDVFVGTFRGCEGSTRHRRKDFTSSEYWNFTVNEHGMYDLKAFIEKIVKIKKSELGASFEPMSGVGLDEPPKPLSESPNKFNIMIIAHSMGAMASLIYLVWSRIKKRPHNIAAAILLSPAGFHKTAPTIVHVMGPIINLALWMFPWIHTLKFPGEWIRLLVSKIIEDVNNSFTGRTMISWGVAKVIGGSIEDHPFVNLRNLTYNVFSGTSTGVFRHFWQIWIHKRFEGYDYGLSKNMELYGSVKPIDFMDNYDKLDLPIYFTMGLNDTLIEPQSIIYQYVSYKNFQPNLAFLKAFPRMGHIDFTIGASEKLIEFILETLRNTCEGREIKDDGDPDELTSSSTSDNE